MASLELLCKSGWLQTTIDLPASASRLLGIKFSLLINAKMQIFLFLELGLQTPYDSQQWFFDSHFFKFSCFPKSWDFYLILE